MTLEERRAWIRLVVAVVAYTAYVIIVLGRAGGDPLVDTAYAGPLLWTIGAAIVAAIVAEVVVAAANPRASSLKDDRDREIGRLGDLVGQPFVVIGALAALLMALADWDGFWIANAIYLCFVLSAVLGGVARVVAYRGHVPQW